MAKWDICQTAFPCGVCKGDIGQGEAFRVSKVPRRVGICEECSIALDGKAQPDHVDLRSFTDRLRDDIAQAPPRPEKSKMPVLVHASQPSFDPRGQRTRRRHGVVEAVRQTTETDWRARRAGERDE